MIESSKPYVFSIAFLILIVSNHFDSIRRPSSEDQALGPAWNEDDAEHGETSTTLVTAGVPTRTQRSVSTAHTPQPPCGVGPGHFPEHTVRNTHRGHGARCVSAVREPLFAKELTRFAPAVSICGTLGVLIIGRRPLPSL